MFMFMFMFMCVCAHVSREIRRTPQADLTPWLGDDADVYVVGVQEVSYTPLQCYTPFLLCSPGGRRA